MKLKVFIPADNLSERDYIVSIILNEFLGIDYQLIIDNNFKDWTIELPNKKKLIIKDSFFNKYPEDLSYLKYRNIPKQIFYAINEFTPEKNIPVIYGYDTNLKKEPTQITCPIDIFASSFFMLTRWEEYVNPIRDKHNRFPAKESLAYKFNFLHRPIVNEYVEMLWNMLKYLGFNGKRKKIGFKYMLTHDIDAAYRYRNFYYFLREIGGDILKRRSLGLAFKSFKRQVKVLLKIEKDPWNTYDYLMDISEKLGFKSYFFLHSSKASKYDVNNDKFISQIAKKIIERGHYIGYHPSYNAYNNLELFLKDKRKIEKMVGVELRFGRQHFLRFEAPTTWQIWEDSKMEWDSTLSYADKEGFRCGVCYPFSVFNFLTRKKLKLKEYPLIVMEGSLINYQNLPPEIVKERIIYYINKVKKYNGIFVFLWHNSSFNLFPWYLYQGIYKEVLGI